MSNQLTPPMDPVQLLAAMVEKGCDPDQLGKMIALKERWDLSRAAEVFGEALAGFQAECRTITKRRSVMNRGGETLRYKFANYEDAMQEAGPLLAKYRISISFSAPTTKERFDMTMRVRVGSYFEDRPYSAPMPDLAKMAAAMFITEPLAFVACTSIHKRNCLVLGLNLVTADEDLEGSQQLATTITKEQVLEIESLIGECAKNGKPVDLPRFMKWLKIGLITEMSQADFLKACAELNRKMAS